MSCLRAFTFALLAAGCSASAPAPTLPQVPLPVLPNIELQNINPLELRAAARATGVGVVLGTAADGGSTVITLTTGRREVTILLPTGDSAQPIAVTLSVAPTADGHVTASDSLQAAALLGALHASLALGKDLADYDFAVSTTAGVSGGSAALAAGFLAALTDTPIVPGSMVLGTLASDGSIVSEPGLGIQLKSARSQDVTKIGVPAGSSLQGTDLVDIANLADAYQLLTERPLPRPMPLAATELALPPLARQVADEGYRRWLGLPGDDGEPSGLTKLWAILLSVDKAGRLPLPLADLAQHAQREARLGQQLYRQGLTFAALDRIRRAWLYAASALDGDTLITLVRNGDLAGAEQLIRDTATLTPWQPPLIDEKATVGQALRQLDSVAVERRLHQQADEVSSHAAATLAHAKKLAATSPSMRGDREVADVLATSMTRLALAAYGYRVSLDDGAMAAQLPADQDLAIPLEYNDASLTRARRGIWRVANALGLQLTSSGDAEQASAVYPAMALADEDLAALGTPKLTSLATAAAAYLEMTRLLEARLSTPPTQATVAEARRMALEHARRAAVALGTVPVLSRRAFQLAEELATGNADDQRDAITAYRNASWRSQLAVILARS